MIDSQRGAEAAAAAQREAWLTALGEQFAGAGSVCVAFSGGVDSSLCWRPPRASWGRSACWPSPPPPRPTCDDELQTAGARWPRRSA